jgi:hypothetical protein
MHSLIFDNVVLEAFLALPSQFVSRHQMLHDIRRVFLDQSACGKTAQAGVVVVASGAFTLSPLLTELKQFYSNKMMRTIAYFLALSAFLTQ